MDFGKDLKYHELQQSLYSVALVAVITMTWLPMDDGGTRIYTEGWVSSQKTTKYVAGDPNLGLAGFTSFFSSLVSNQFFLERKYNILFVWNLKI